MPSIARSKNHATSFEMCTLPETNMAPEKWMVRRLVSVLNGFLAGAFPVSFRECNHPPKKKPHHLPTIEPYRDSQFCTMGTYFSISSIELMLLMEEILHQLIGSLSTFCRVLYIPGGCLGFLIYQQYQSSRLPCEYSTMFKRQI